MTIYPAHHTYNIQLTENVFQSNLFASKLSIAAPNIDLEKESLDYQQKVMLRNKRWPRRFNGMHHASLPVTDQHFILSLSIAI
jgi:hypothetical protein